MLPIGQPSNEKIPGEKLPLKVGYFWTGLQAHTRSLHGVGIYGTYTLPKTHLARVEKSPASVFDVAT